MYGEAEIEATEKALQAERERTIARIRGGLDGQGADDCARCGEPIPAARRAALPSAERCVACQARLERGYA